MVKLPGQIIGGLVAGITQAAADKKTVAEKEKEIIDAQNSLAEARREAIQLQSGTANQTGASLYLSQTLTVYPFSNALENAVRAQAALAEERRKGARGAAKGKGHS